MLGYPDLTEFLDMQVIRDDVHACGYINKFGLNRFVTIPVYWKNGRSQELPVSINSFAKATSIFIEKNDIYISGYEFDSLGNSKAVYWKNGVRTALGNAESNSKANVIFVKDNELYVAGSQDSHAAYWKENVLYTLDYGRYASEVFDLKIINDTSVVTVGSKDTVNRSVYPVCWKNFSRTDLANHIREGEAHSILIKNDDILFFGFQSHPSTQLTKACYWKQGTVTFLDDKPLRSYCYDAYLDGDDWYACGSEGKNNEYSTAVYWQNGQSHLLPAPASSGNSNAKTIALHKHNLRL